MLQTGILKDIRQMAIEFHVTLKPDRSRRYKEEPPRDKYFFALSLFKDLYDLGFRIFWTHRNPTCKFFSKKGNVERVTCHEVSFVNINNMWGVCYWFCQLQVCSSISGHKKFEWSLRSNFLWPESYRSATAMYWFCLYKGWVHWVLFIFKFRASIFCIFYATI